MISHLIFLNYIYRACLSCNPKPHICFYSVCNPRQHADKPLTNTKQRTIFISFYEKKINPQVTKIRCLINVFCTCIHPKLGSDFLLDGDECVSLASISRSSRFRSAEVCLQLRGRNVKLRRGLTVHFRIFSN